MVPGPSRSGRRSIVIALLIGGIHAVAVAAVVDRLAYPIDPLQHAPGGLAGAVVGSIAVVAVPTYLALRIGLLLPAIAAGIGAVRPVYAALAGPRPTFSELGGHTVVQGARPVAAYVDAWYVWLLAYLLVGLAEYVARVDHPPLPPPRRIEGMDRLLGDDALAAYPAAVLVGAATVAVFLILAADWGYFEPRGFLPSPWSLGLATLAWSVLGLAIVGGVAGFLLVRARLLLPTLGLAWLVRRTGVLQNQPLPDDPLPVLFLGWFVYAGLLLGLGALEYSLRRAVARFHGPRLGRG